MSMAIQESDKDLSKYVGNAYSNAEIEIIRRTVAKNTTDSELMYFLNVCKASDLSPFNKEIWCYKDYKGNLITFTGRDGFLKRANASGNFAGIRSSEVCEQDEFEADIPAGIVKHKIKGFSRGKIIGAYAIVFKKQGECLIELASMAEHDKGQSVWKTNPSEMIKKTAESRALKKAFGITGVQSEDDWQVQDDKVKPINVTPEIETKRKLDDKEFELFIQSEPEFVLKFVDKYDFTGKQQKTIDNILETLKEDPTPAPDQAEVPTEINGEVSRRLSKLLSHKKTETKPRKIDVKTFDTLLKVDNDLLIRMLNRYEFTKDQQVKIDEKLGTTHVLDNLEDQE